MLRVCARAGGKILTVHSVRAATSVLDLVEGYLPPSHGRVVLHWFTGTKTEARRAVDLGCYFSINLEMMRNERRRAVVAALPLDRLLTETDGPFTQVSGRPTRPPDVAATVEALARARATATATTAAAIRKNLKRLESEYADEK